MKILFLTDGIHPFQLGGMQKHSLVLSRLLAGRGVELHLFHPGGKDYSKAAFDHIFEYQQGFIQEQMVPFPKLDSLPGHYIRENRSYSKLIYGAVIDHIDQYDLIYAQGFTASYFIRMKLKGKIKLPILVNFHGFEMFQKAPNLRVRLEHELLRKEVRFNLQNADGVFTFGGKINRILLEIGVPRERLLLQTNGIEKSWLTEQLPNVQRNQQRTLTFIGRNERRKGIEELNKALRDLVRRTDLTFRFNFIGPIPEGDKIDDKRIVYHGEIRESDHIKEILEHSDCLVCPSHSEGMPTVILEGMACGLAIIATDVGAVSRMVKKNGILLKAPDPEVLKEAIKSIIEINTNDLQKMKLKSMEVVREEFLWDVIVDKQIAQFNRVIATK